MNPELELSCDELEALEAEYRAICAAEFDGLYAAEAAHEQEALMIHGANETPW